MASTRAETLHSRSCLFFLSRKGCNNGQSCAYSHIDDINLVKTQFLCRFNNSQKGCLRGATCYFRHTQTGYISSTTPVCNFKVHSRKDNVQLANQMESDQFGLSKLTSF